MSEFHGAHKSHSYFEGWYFKHQNGGHTIAFIPGVNYDEQGRKSAFVQVITDDVSCNVPFSFSDFNVSTHGLGILLRNQIFGERGVKIDLKTPEIRCKGTIKYGPLTPPKYDVMGPFRFVPFMECHHGVISMKHRLQGMLEVNGTQINFDNGTGYIEKDWGTSFPKSYLWVQCNRFRDAAGSVMISVADIPFGKFSFKGCICIVHYWGNEYRLTTYNGVRIIRCDETGLILKQREYVLKAEFSKNAPQNLFAPQIGAMSRIIRENAACHVRCRFYREGTLLFDLQSEEAGFEYVE